MLEFKVEFSSFEDVVEFVSLATVQPFRVIVGNGYQWVNAKSLMGLVALDQNDPLRVRMECSAAEWESFRHASEKFLAS